MFKTKRRVKQLFAVSLALATMATGIFAGVGSVYADNDTPGTESFSGKEINRILKDLAYRSEYGDPVSEIDYLTEDNIIEKIEWADSVPEDAYTVSLSSNGRLVAWYMSAESLAEQDKKEKESEKAKEESSEAETLEQDGSENTDSAVFETEAASLDTVADTENDFSAISDATTNETGLSTETETVTEEEMAVESSETYYNTVFLYFDGSTDDGTDDGLVMRYNPDMSYAFSEMNALTDVSGLSHIGAGKVADMSYMFSGDDALEDISPLASFVTTSLENVTGMFKDCTSLADASALNENQAYGLEDTTSAEQESADSLQAESTYTVWDVPESLNALSMFDGTQVSVYPDWYQEILNDAADKTSGIDFSSKRLLVITDDEALMQNVSGVISSYDGMYILQYGTEEEVKSVYSYLSDKVSVIEIDSEMSVSSSGDGTFEYVMGEQDNPVAALKAAGESGTGVYDIALIDTGSMAFNVYGSVSLIDDSPSDLNGHGTQVSEKIGELNSGITVLSVKAFDENGNTTVSTIYAALKYVMTQDVKMIVLPKDVFAGSTLLEQAKNEITAAGITIAYSSDDMSAITGMFGEEPTEEETLAEEEIMDEIESVPEEQASSVEQDAEAVTKETVGEESSTFADETASVQETSKSNEEDRETAKSDEESIETESKIITEPESETASVQEAIETGNETEVTSEYNETENFIQETEAPTETGVPETRTGTVQVVKSVDAAVGHIEFALTDSNTSITAGNDCYSLEGAVYGIYSDEGCTDEISEMVTDTDGKAKSEDLELGTYYVKEIAAPSGYEPDDTVYVVVVKDVSVTFNKASTYTIYKGTIAVDNLVCDAQTGISDALVLDEGTYTLTETMPAAGYKQNYDAYEFTVKDGEMTYLTENNTDILSGIQEKEIKVSLNISRKPQLTGEAVLLYKESRDGQKPISGTVFKIEFFGNYNAVGSVLRTWYYKTDENGEINLTDAMSLASGAYRSDALYYDSGNIILPLGSVKVTEIVAAERYELSSGAFTGTVISSGEGASFVWTDNGQISIRQDNEAVSYGNEKYTDLTIISESSDGERLSGTEFEVYNSDRSDIRSITVDGEALVTDLTEGLWYIKETKFPEIVTDEVKAVLVERDTDGSLGIYEYSLTGNSKTGSKIDSVTFNGVACMNINISVTDSETGKTNGVSDLFPSGTVFTIYEWSETGQTYTELTECRYKDDFSSGTLTAVSGVSFYDTATNDVLNLYWSEENQGKFTILETSAAGGYVADGNEKKLVISKDGKSYTLDGEEYKTENKNIEITFENNPNQYVIRNADEDGNALPGATFTYKRTYTNENGKTVTTEEITVKDGVKSARTEAGSDGFGDYIEADNGYIVLKGLGTGTYEYWESEAPEGYDANVTHYTFTVDKNGKIAGDVSAIGPTVTNPVENEFYYAITKTSDGNPLEGINFEVQYGTVTDIYTTDSNGMIDLTSLLKRCFESGIKTVQFRESQSQTLLPYGIVPADESWTTITLMGDTSLVKSVTKNDSLFTDSVVSYQYEAKSETNKVRIKSVNTNNRAMSDMVFLVTSPSGEEFRLVTKDNGFTDYITKLENGTWTYREVSAPDGYVVNSEEKTFNVNMETHLVNGVAEKNLVTTSVCNSLTVTTVDADSENPVEGITYCWGSVNDTNETIQYVTDENGQFTISKIPDGTYSLTQVTTTGGYILNDGQTFEVKNGHIYCNGEDLTDVETGEAFETLTNSRWSLRIIRTDADDNILTGAMLSINGDLFNSKGNDVYGTLGAGMYMVQEVRAPFESSSFRDEIIFVINSQGNVSGVSPEMTTDETENEIILKITH